MRRALAGLALVALALYFGDYLSLALRIPRREPLGSVEVRRIYAVALKNHKTEYLFDEPRTEVCVNSLLPHDGHQPCWYLSRHKRQEITVDPGPHPLF
jgi:hypothetical protein